ncbi:hypothetical protein EC396_04310 [Lutibacter sp. HS1-25]|uniref:DUF6873 family GME fold protein n=1 Tax=Lutibacter sp. HS1-25 TaxID=2485000 RepID=UPI001012AC26|nr:hypothetical protein [Lutibacter sp. HS1-25]RXP60883.1 hypothetical protein EC396_04310 [Lutibacter sp. HS1-25]
MYAIIDKRTPLEVKKNLEKYVDDIFEFSSEDITYNAISGHPDIFMFQDANKLIIAPNTTKELINFLDKKAVNYTFGTNPVGKNIDNSVLYNCLSTKKYFFCKKGKPDISIQKWCSLKQLVNIPQSYARCSMFTLDDTIITSDNGIVKALKKAEIAYFYFDPSEIRIIDHKNGFIGGTMGMIDNKVLFLGNILKHKDGKALDKYIATLKKETICLGNDYLYDGGGLFFVSSK